MNWCEISWTNWFEVLVCTLCSPSRAIWYQAHLPNVLGLDSVLKCLWKDMLPSCISCLDLLWTPFELFRGWLRRSWDTNSLLIVQLSQSPLREDAFLSWPPDNFQVLGHFYFLQKSLSLKHALNFVRISPAIFIFYSNKQIFNFMCIDLPIVCILPNIMQMGGALYK